MSHAVILTSEVRGPGHPDWVPVPAVRTVKAERRLRERQQRELGPEAPEEADGDGVTAGLASARQRALEAEKRAAWRQARYTPHLRNLWSGFGHACVLKAHEVPWRYRR